MLVPSSFFERGFFDHWFDHWNDREVAQFVPKVGITEQEQAFALNLDLPGFKKSDLQVEVKDEQLIVKGERRRHKKHDDNCCLREERVFGAFERRFVLPQSVERGKIAVSYNDGVLQVTMPKHAKAAAHRLEISG